MIAHALWQPKKPYNAVCSTVHLSIVTRKINAKAYINSNNGREHVNYNLNIALDNKPQARWRVSIVTAKSIFLADLRSTIHAHQADVESVFQPVYEAALAWRPAPKEWSILLCFDHLNQTHAYYRAKIARALTDPVQIVGDTDNYRASFWGRIYMFFALNPRWSFPTPEALLPSAAPQRIALDDYLARQQTLLDLFKTLDTVDLTRTLVPIEKNISFNLGDCLKILVYHDSLHIRQAHNVLAQVQ